MSDSTVTLHVISRDPDFNLQDNLVSLRVDSIQRVEFIDHYSCYVYFNMVDPIETINSGDWRPRHVTRENRVFVSGRTSMVKALIGRVAKANGIVLPFLT